MKSILIVEDDFYICDLYSRAFRRAGYEVKVSMDGKEAIEIISKKVFDIILLDIMLPKATGIEVLRSLREANSNSKSTPVFLITNLGQDEIIKQAFKIGADGYLLKSQLTPGQVVKEIGAFFEDQEKEKEFLKSQKKQFNT